MTSGKLSCDDLYRQLKAMIAAVEPDNAPQEAVWLFEHLFGHGRDWLLTQGGQEADPRLAEQALALARRRAAGEPLQYLLGEWEFYGLTLAVGPGVLIPRPETELLVELGLGHIRDIPSPVLLDICSGSGCIPLALGRCRPDAAVWGVELFAPALAYFVENAARTACGNVTPVQGNLFDLPPDITGRRYHLITSNPPYLTAAEMAQLQAEVAQEPATALLGGPDGLDFYRALPAIGARLLLAGGMLAVEIGESQGRAVAGLLEQGGYRQVTVHRDYAGHDRVVTGLWAQWAAC